MSQPYWTIAADLAQGQALAQRGETEHARRIADQGEAALLPAGAFPMLAMVQLVRGTAAIAEGRHSEAYEELRPIFDPDALPYHPGSQFSGLWLLAEAAIHCGRQDELGATVRSLDGTWAQGRSPALGIDLAYAKALLAQQERAGELFTSALSADLTSWPFQRARLQLAFGTWLRRQRRVAECRPHLRSAVETFDALGAAPWAQRAAQELAASGETLRRADRHWERLTPQELQIAQLAADGLNNNDIAQRLFVSPRTVTTHLSRAFTKLGIGSRADLAGALNGLPAGR